MVNKELTLKNDIIFKEFFSKKGNEKFLIDFLTGLLEINITKIEIFSINCEGDFYKFQVLINFDNNDLNFCKEIYRNSLNMLKYYRIPQIQL